MKRLLTILSLVLPIIMFGETLSKQEVYLSKDKSKVSLIEITETHEGNRTTIVADTVKNLYPSENAKAYMTQRNAEILMNKSNLVRLSDSLVPRKTHLFGKDRYEKYSLEIEGDKIFHYYKGYYYKPANKGCFYFAFLEMIAFLLVSLFGCYMAKTKSMILSIRWTVFTMFIMFSVVHLATEIVTLIDNFVLNIIATLPAFIATFFFNKRIKRIEAKSVKI